DALASCCRASLGLRVTPVADALAVMLPRSAGAKGDAGCGCAGGHAAALRWG
ncbi:TPA: hypothetical protein RY542_004354, partial [Yersinia enterocolitica]|nr:hypothetical protein [Yersinia enterocolitica]